MKRYPILLLIACFIFLFNQNAWSKVYQNQGRTYNTQSSPIDISGSADGKYTFILLEGGKVMVYAASGETDQIDVSPEFDKIYASATGDKIILSSHKTSKIQEIDLDFIKKINIEGSPFLGQKNAPVVLAVFSDFQ